jgi:hypothetical protein
VAALPSLTGSGLHVSVQTKAGVAVNLVPIGVLVGESRMNLCERKGESGGPPPLGCLIDATPTRVEDPSVALLYSCWKTRVIGVCAGLTTLTVMVPSAARV